MKYAPKSLLIATLSAFVLWSCQDQSKKEKPRIDTEIEKPELKQNDSTRTTRPDSQSLPDARHPDRPNKKKTDDLDSLRAIKA